MRLVNLSEANETLEALKDSYEKKKLLIEDQIHDDQIEKAKETFEQILGLQKAIERMENLQVQMD